MARKRKGWPALEDVRRVMADVDALDLPDGAHWALVHDLLGLEYGDVFDLVANDPEFFGVEPEGRDEG